MPAPPSLRGLRWVREPSALVPAVEPQTRTRVLEGSLAHGVLGGSCGQRGGVGSGVNPCAGHVAKGAGRGPDGPRDLAPSSPHPPLSLAPFPASVLARDGPSRPAAAGDARGVTCLTSPASCTCRTRRFTVRCWASRHRPLRSFRPWERNVSTSGARLLSSCGGRCSYVSEGVGVLAGKRVPTWRRVALPWFMTEVVRGASASRHALSPLAGSRRGQRGRHGAGSRGGPSPAVLPGH